MAGEVVEYDLSFQDKSGSMKKRIDDAKTLNKEMSKAAQSAFKAEGSKLGEGTEYGRARGSMGATGAGARDFANQAQGLGGLVRLYATVAANLFAVGAAFNALREAMNTTNMVEGLNQLGAASGQSLGTLAKNLAQASGGAISLRDAMEATAKATAAGISGKQLMQLGVVARNAAQALGLSMTDAVNRLSRGITKLEPELLDELGLFTKLDMATQQYALSVGKSAAALTDYERRQAFANAVLAEGLQKFGEINIPTNPYDKLLASLKDLAQNGLEVVNKYLGPLISALSQSPSALTAAIAAVGVTLIKQALPAIGEYRRGLVESAQAAKELAESKAAQAAAAQATVLEKIRQQAEASAEAEIAEVDRAAKRIEEIRGSSFGKQSKGYAILQKATQDITKEELEYLQKVGKRYENQKKFDVAQRYYDAVTAINASKRAEEAYGRVVEENTKKLKEQANILTARGQAEALARRTAAIAASKGIVSQAAQDTGTIGAVGAFKEMIDSIGKSDQMGPFRKAFTGIAGTISIATTAVTGFISAIQGVLFAGALVVTALKAVDAFFTSTAEQTEAFNRAVSDANESVKTYERTLAFLAKTDPENIFQAKSIQAQANAFNGLAEGLTNVREKFQELEQAQGAWDKFVNGLFSVVGKDQFTKFAESTVKQIAQTIAAIDTEAERATAEQQISSLLGARGTGQIAWLEAIKEQGPEAAKSIKQVEEVFNRLSKQQLISASRSQEFDESLKKINNTYKEFTRSAADNSPLTRLGEDLVSASVKMAGALEDPINALGSMKRLLQETTTLGIFSPALVQQVNRLKPEIDNLNKLHGQTTVELKKARQEVAALQLDYEKVQKSYEDVSQGLLMSDTGGFDAQYEALQAAGEKLQKAQAKLLEISKRDTEERKKIAELMADPVFNRLIVDGFVKGSEVIRRQLDMSFEKARIELSRGILSLIGDIPGVAQLEKQLNEQEFNQRQYLINLQQEMLKAQHLQTAATMANTAAINLATAKETAQNAWGRTDRTMIGGAASAAADAQAIFDVSQRFQEVIAGRGDKRTFLQDLDKTIKNLSKATPEATSQLNTMRAAVTSLIGMEAERAGIDSQRKLSNLKTEKKLNEDNAKRQNELIKQRDLVVADELRSLDLLQQQNGFLTEGQILRRQLLQDQQADNALATVRNTLAAEQSSFDMLRSELAKTRTKEQLAELDASFKLLQTTKEDAAKKEASGRKSQNQLQANLEIIRAMSREEAFRLKLLQLQRDTLNIQETSSIEVAQLDLDLAIKRKQLSDDEIARAKAELELRRINQEEASKLASTDIAWQQRRNELFEEFNKLSEGPESDVRKQQITDELNALSNKRTVELQGIKNVSDARRRAAEEDAKYSTRQLAYADAIEKAFQGMADAIIDFAKTGKLNFSNMINSMIEDLIRFELQMQAKMLYGAMRPGLLGLLGNMFGSTPGAIAPEAGGGTYALTPTKLAKGGVFDYGVEKFAKGGMFTNSIVNSPTLFKFAQGTGLMGEAGPEAIMPLRRDNEGNLGVIAQPQSGNVEVVVNNYSSAQAETRETTDSRGNRRIEVVVGEMVAGEVARTGSQTQQAFMNTFGTRPALARR